MYLTVRKQTKVPNMTYDSYVICYIQQRNNRNTSRSNTIVGCYKEFYETSSAAKAALTSQDNKGKLGEHSKADFAIAETSDFRANIEKTVTRTNAMTGKEFQEPIITPYATSPASETFWAY